MSGTPAHAQPANTTPQYHPWRLSIGLLGTALAWFALMLIGEGLTATTCALSDPVRPAAPPSWAMVVMIALSAVCVALGIAGAVLAWRNVVFTREKRQRPLEGRARRVAELESFLAKVGALCSAMFMFGLIATVLAVAILAPCGQW
ncbi:hypothetical protein [Paraburkholderia rhizosphaerae]|uniref:Uncharacterized protein n=1 Tax=Paraburkholderia rhizosphaerae TaxID=480658 RepID=A0A4R8LAP3_9BURK|nr:hypothetical protein [Paraburkholderia rhizosphaerae]TDY39040.1 hypothetical protein BX592_12844 [Paraburkholderia rhizosphaerae]